MELPEAIDPEELLLSGRGMIFRVQFLPFLITLVLELAVLQ